MAKRLTGSQRMTNYFHQLNVEYFNKTLEQKINYINAYATMSAHQRVALEQCKNLMSEEEKQAYRKAIQAYKKSQVSHEEEGPQPS